MPISIEARAEVISVAEALEAAAREKRKIKGDPLTFEASHQHWADRLERLAQSDDRKAWRLRELAGKIEREG